MSYLTVAEASEYFAAHRLIAYAWTDAAPEQQTIALQMGTDLINALNYADSKADPEQEDQFPRGEQTIVPVEVQWACAEIAYMLLDGYNSEYEIDNVRATSIKFANIASKYDGEVVPYHKIEGIPSRRAWDLLQPFLRSNGTINLTRIS